MHSVHESLICDQGPFLESPETFRAYIERILGEMRPNVAVTFGKQRRQKTDGINKFANIKRQNCVRT